VAEGGPGRLRRIPYEAAIGDPGQVQPGHVFFIDAGQGHGHTGLVVGREGNEFQTIEGNTNELAAAARALGCLLDRVRCARRPLDSLSSPRADRAWQMPTTGIAGGRKVGAAVGGWRTATMVSSAAQSREYQS